MKKKTMILFLPILLIFLVAGSLAVISLVKFLPSILSSRETQGNIGQQSTLLIIHVDQLATTEPTIRSVWAVFAQQSTTQSIIFKKLILKNELLPISNDMEKADEFLQQIAKEQQLDLDGFIIMDDAALASLVDLTTQNDQEKLAEGELISLESLFCQSEPEVDPSVIEPFNWNGLIPDHLKTNMAINLLNQTIESMFSMKDGSCKMITE